MKHIVFYSSGIASFATAHRIINKFGKNNCLLLFADTLIEDEDNYRFLQQSSELLDTELIWLWDGRTPWENAMKLRFPLCWEPWLSRPKYFELCQELNITPPRLYQLGFSHANCGGFCVRAGKAQFERFLEVFPDRYKYHEEQEEKLQEFLSQKSTILTESVNGERKRISLKELREKIQSTPKQGTLFDDWGGCNCFTADNDNDE